jgi:hypothetical protein
MSPMLASGQGVIPVVLTCFFAAFAAAILLIIAGVRRLSRNGEQIDRPFGSRVAGWIFLVIGITVLIILISHL